MRERIYLFPIIKNLSHMPPRRWSNKDSLQKNTRIYLNGESEKKCLSPEDATIGMFRVFSESNVQFHVTPLGTLFFNHDKYRWTRTSIPLRIPNLRKSIPSPQNDCGSPWNVNENNRASLSKSLRPPVPYKLGNLLIPTCKSFGSDLALVRVLLESGADPNVAVDIFRGNESLHIVAG